MIGFKVGPNGSFVGPDGGAVGPSGSIVLGTFSRTGTFVSIYSRSGLISRRFIELTHNNLTQRNAFQVGVFQHPSPDNALQSSISRRALVSRVFTMTKASPLVTIISSYVFFGRFTRVGQMTIILNKRLNYYKVFSRVGSLVIKFRGIPGYGRVITFLKEKVGPNINKLGVLFKPSRWGS